jgi:hypothetical protein
VWARAACSQGSQNRPLAPEAARSPTRSLHTHSPLLCHSRRSALHFEGLQSRSPSSETDPILSHTYIYSHEAPAMILRLSWLLAILVPCVFADVKFTSPAAGATVSGPTISIEWEESGDAPKIADLASYQLFLCAGGNDQSSFVYRPVPNPDASNR